MEIMKMFILEFFFLLWLYDYVFFLLFFRVEYFIIFNYKYVLKGVD